tara:strand:- start:3302 stop:3499 length:198 start_codon:yes stop_codon:yes gene_type:complete
MNWNKLKIQPSSSTTDDDIHDFVEWVYKKAERLGFQVELETYQETGSGSSEAVSTNPLDSTNESN